MYLKSWNVEPCLFPPLKLFSAYLPVHSLEPEQCFLPTLLEILWRCSCYRIPGSVITTWLKIWSHIQIKQTNLNKTNCIPNTTALSAHQSSEHTGTVGVFIGRDSKWATSAFPENGAHPPQSQPFWDWSDGGKQGFQTVVPQLGIHHAFFAKLSPLTAKVNPHHVYRYRNSRAHRLTDLFLSCLL